MKKKIGLILISIILTISLNGCGGNDQTSKLKVLCFISGDVDDYVTGYDFYKDIEQVSKKSKLKVDFMINSLAYNEDYYASTVNELLKRDYDAFILGDERVSKLAESVLHKHQDKKIIAVDSNYKQTYSNVYEINYNQEELGFVAGFITSKLSSTGKVGFYSDIESNITRATEYGFMQGANYVNENSLKVTKYTEEFPSNYFKTLDYANHSFEYVDVIYSESIKNANAMIDAAYQNETLIVGGVKDFYQLTKDERDEDHHESITTSIVKSTVPGIIDALSNLDAENFGRKEIYSFKNNGFILKNNKINDDLVSEINELIKKLNNGTVTVKKFKDNVSDFKELRETMEIKDQRPIFTLKSSITAYYHEGIPNVHDTSNWKYAPRFGSYKPVSWKASAQWATFYLQDGADYVENTGIEITNMKFYGYKESTNEWVLITHTMPQGNFYDKDFKDDFNKDFPNNRRYDFDTKTTTILLDKSTEGFNYHPFSEQIDLAEIDMVDVKYVISVLDARLVKWDENGPDNIDDAKYVANVGGDWWIRKGAMWLPDWSANKDIAIGQYRTLTRDWKTVYMCNVPSEIFDDIVPVDILDK